MNTLKKDKPNENMQLRHSWLTNELFCLVGLKGRVIYLINLKAKFLLNEKL